MIIGYDGKRAFQNETGLGNYSRSLITILAKNFSKNRYVLFAPKKTSLFETALFSNTDVKTPQKFYKYFPSLWRRKGMVIDLSALGLNIYHGLSNELPQGIEKTSIKTVVTVHDLIFERFPGTYNFDERYTHRWKIKRACKIADAVIAISNQTKKDLVDLYGVNEAKIFTCYQSCNPIFEQHITDFEKTQAKIKYGLPDNFFLFVSSVTSRKNLLTICKALILLKDKINIPLVIIGDGKKEKQTVKSFMNAHGMSNHLLFLNELSASKENAFTSAQDFPAIYQQALALIYPSVFEGFGLPILEALWSKVPVICSNTSSMPEVAGDAALYFEPMDHELLARHMHEIVTTNGLADELRQKGLQQAKKFISAKYGDTIMEVYKSII